MVKTHSQLGGGNSTEQATHTTQQNHSQFPYD